MITMLDRRACLIALGAGMVASPVVAPVRAQPAKPDWIELLKGGGYVLIMRHGATHQDQADTDPLNLANVDKQRQLNDAGRTKAREIGAAVRKLGIPIGQVVSSQYFRAIETGRLMGFGEPQATPDVAEGGQVVTPIENNRRTAAMRRLAGTALPGTNLLVVTHKPNILDAFGKDWFDVKEGEISIFKPDGNGGYQLVARVQADDWAKLAQ